MVSLTSAVVSLKNFTIYQSKNNFRKSFWRLHWITIFRFWNFRSRFK